MPFIYSPWLHVEPAKQKQWEGEWRGQHQGRLIILGQAGDHVACAEETRSTVGDDDEGNMSARLEKTMYL